MENRFMTKTILRICLVLMLMFIALIARPAAAQTLAFRNSPGPMRSIRALGMGNAFIAVDSADESTLFYNPAGINDLEQKIHMQFALPTAMMSYKAIDFVKDVKDLADAIDAAGSDAAKTNAFNAFAATHTGRYEEADVQGSLVNFMYKYLAASLFYENRSVAALTNPASSTIDVEAVTMAGLQVGSAYSFFDGKLQVGGALKFIERHMIDETITQRDVIANNTFGDIIDTKQYGFGVGGDIGVKGRLPVNGRIWEKLDPVLAVTLQNIGDTRFTGNVGRLQESLTAGAAIHPNFWKLKNSFALDVRDLDHAGDFITKLYTGFEFTYPEIGKVLHSASLRVGAGQGYVSAGFGLDFHYFKLNAATWGSEVGQKSRQKESRMFGVQLASGF
jgi:hypothetical protein